jgi:hypothetical protein
MRSEKSAAFLKGQQITTDTSGRAHATFETMWGAAFLVIPPLGLVPSHPPKPAYAITVADKQFVVSPDSPGVSYRWDHGSWHTQGAVDIP